MHVCVYPGEECVEAVHLLPLSNVGIVLRDALERQLFHQINLIGLLQMLRLEEGTHIHHRAAAATVAYLIIRTWLPLIYHEFLHTDGKGGGIQQNLSVLVQEADDILNEHHKILGEQLISL